MGTASCQMVEYLGRYTHKVAVSNHRLRSVDESGVQFLYLDYRDNRKKQMKLSGVEFLRRFSQHILPKGFVRIRHYGLLSACKRTQLRQLQTALGVQVPEKKEKKDWKQLCREHLGFDPDQCPECKQGRMVVVQWLSAVRGPPEKHWNLQSAHDHFIGVKSALKNLSAAGIISTNNTEKCPAFPL